MSLCFDSGLRNILVYDYWSIIVMECGIPVLVIIVVLANGVRMAVAICLGLSFRFFWFCPCWVVSPWEASRGCDGRSAEGSDDLSCQRRPPCHCPEE